ncbi:MAG: hypothetical protein AAGI53_04260 [Planctomycetota bacterium]
MNTRSIIGTVLAACGAAASAQPTLPGITVVNGFLLQTWNAGTTAPGRSDWHPDRPGNGWANGLTWDWQNLDGNMDPIPPAIVPIFDSSVPGITGAFRFPEARAVNRTAAAWESQAQPGTGGTFEVWFKPDDLVGTHVIWEMGATNKGVAFALEDDELVYSVFATDGAGGNVIDYEHRETLTGTGWHQAVITVDFFGFQVNSFLNGQGVNSQGGFAGSATYRWASGNPAGLGQVGSDPLFPTAGIAGDSVPVANVTDFEGYISTIRFYNIDLFGSEVAANYDALTDAAAADRRADFNGDALADADDVLGFLMLAGDSDTSAITPFNFAFPHATGGGVQTNDPFLDETYDGDFTWDRDDGFNPTSQEPSFQLSAGTFEPMPINDTSIPNIRRAWVLDGSAGFRGPKFEQADDTSSGHVEFWLHVDDLVGTHCLFEAGGSGVGFSIISRDDEVAAFVNTSANDGLDVATLTSGAGFLTTGWHKFELVIRRFAGGGLGQGFEMYVDGVLIDAINDEPGLDGEFGTADDINNFSPAGTGNSNFIGGNQAGLAQIQGSAAVPFGLVTGDFTPFNGMVGPFRLNQAQPLPADIAANFAAGSSQNVINGRGDINTDGSSNFFDVLDVLKMNDASE